MEISKFFPKDAVINDYVAFFNLYNNVRCADGHENVYDLSKFEDFGNFVEHYGTAKALSCKKYGRFWIGGFNFQSPIRFPNTIEECKSLIDTSVDEDIVFENLDVFQNFLCCDELDAFFFLNGSLKNMAKLRYFRYYMPNNQYQSELNYNVVLQYFTIICMKDIWDGQFVKDDVCFDDFLNVVANIAYDFAEKYKKTNWNSYFVDYARKYIGYRLACDENFSDMIAETKLNSLIYLFVYD